MATLSSSPTMSNSVSATLSRYLEQRGIVHPSTWQSTDTTLTLPQFALRSLVLDLETSTNDVVQFSYSTQDPTQIEQQYSKFKIWISESPDSFKPELAQLLYPTFTHLYLELVSCGQRQFAQKFHKRHQSTFLGNAEFASFIRQLTPIQTPADILNDPTVSAFHSCKYSVTLSNRTFQFLMKYLQSCGQPILLHVLRGKVDLKLADALGASSKTESLKRMEQERRVAELEEKEAQPDIDTKNVSISHLMSTLQSVRDGVSPLPTSCLFKLSHPQSHFTSSSLSADCSILAAGCEDSSVRLWALTPSDIPDNPGDREEEVSNDCHEILLGCDAITQTMYEPNCNNLSDKNGDSRKLIGHRGPVYDVAFIRQGMMAQNLSQLVLSVSEDTTMRVWDTSNGLTRAVYCGHSYPVWCLDVDSLGMSIATGSMDRTAKLWHLEHTHPIRVYVGHEMDVDCVRFHPNCNYVATGSVDKTIRLWSHADAKMVRVFHGHKGAVCTLAFSPNGKFLASAGEDRRIKVWDLAASSVLHDLKGHTDNVSSLSWSNDSGILVSGGLDGTIRLWDLQQNMSGPNANYGNSCSPQMLACWPTQANSVLDLKYSLHNTLCVTAAAFTKFSSNE